MTKDEIYAQNQKAAENYASFNPGYAKMQENWKKKQQGKHVPLPDDTYTIDIPGMRDIFKLPLPYMQDKQLKRERYQRFKTAKSPVPESFSWIRDAVTKIDNAQDLLYCALFLAKPLLRRLPARFIPYVGWILLVSDLMNLINGIFGLALTPGLSKPCVRKTANNYRRPKKLLNETFRSWIAPTGWRRWVGFALQAPQALESLTGYGMVLGSVMGVVSNFVWGIPRILSGDKVVFRGPPPADPVSKAANYLTNDFFDHNMRDILTPEEHALLICAHNVALTILFDANVTLDMSRLNLVENCPVIHHEPWDPTTLEVLQEGGEDLREEPDHFTTIKNPTYGDAIKEGILEYPNWLARMNEISHEEDYNRWSVIYQIFNEASYETIEDVTGIPRDEFLEDDYRIKIVEELASLDIMPLVPVNREQATQIFNLATIKAKVRGTVFPSADDWRSAMETISGPVISKSKRTVENIVWSR